MKLTTKLLPIATLGAVASVVVPLATSCGSNHNWIDGSKDVDTKGWTQHEAKQYKEVSESDRTQLVKDYLTEVGKDANIAYNDFTFSTNAEYKVMKEVLDKALKKLGDEYPVESYEIKTLSGWLSDVSVVESNSKHYISYNTGIKVNLDVKIKGKITLFGFTEDLNGTLTLKANLTCHYNNILGDVYLKDENVPDLDLISSFFGIKTYPHSMFYSNLMLMVMAPEVYPAIDGSSFSYEGSASAKYLNDSDQRLNLNFSLDGGKSFDEIPDLDDWDPLTTVCMALTGQWYSYYLDSVTATPKN